MIARTETRAFYGLPPKSIKPSAHKNVRSERRKRIRTFPNLSPLSSFTKRKSDEVDFPDFPGGDRDDDSDGEHILPPCFPVKL